MKTLCIITAAAAVCQTSLFGADLNAPAAKQVTVGSEIERGMDALHSAPPFSHEFHEFVERTVSANKQKNTDTDRFLFGIYYQAWHRAWSAASIGLKDPPIQGWAELDAGHFHLLATGMRKKIGLTDEEVKGMAGPYYVPDEDIVFPKIKETKTKAYKGTYPLFEDQLKQAAAAK